MNKKQIEKLWLMANKLRGAFQISDLYKIMLYALLLKYVEYEKEVIMLYDEKYSLGYLSLTYGKMIEAREILEYIGKLEKDLNLDAGILSESIDQILSKADKENVRIIFKELNNLGFESKEEYYELAEAIINKMIASAGRTGGEFGTNVALAKLEAALLDTQDGMTVYDAFCGSGISGNKVSAGKGKLFMQDINISTIGIAAITTILSNNELGAVKCADSLQNPIQLHEKYDRVVCEPPFMPRYDKDYIIEMPYENYIYQGSLDSESLALRHAMASLKENGAAVVLVPMGMLFKSGRVGEIRQNFVEDGYIDAVIELPNGVVTGTMVATALLVLKKDKTDKNIFVINAKDFFGKVERNHMTITDESIKRLVKIYRNNEVIEGVSNTITKEMAADNGYNLCTIQYVVSKAEDTIVIEDTTEYVEKYDQLLRKLSVIDKELNAVRSRFVKEA